MKNAHSQATWDPGPSQAESRTAASTSLCRRPNARSLLRLLGSDTLKLRYETGDTVIYRKHWVVLVHGGMDAVAGYAWQRSSCLSSG